MQRAQACVWSSLFVLIGLIQPFGQALAHGPASDGAHLGAALRARMNRVASSAQPIDQSATLMPLWVRSEKNKHIFERRMPARQWVSMQLGLGQLNTLLDDSDLRIRLAPPHRPMLDDSVPEIGAEAVHAGYGLDSAYRGAGVLVGLIDTGIDYLHSDFLDADGRTRVVAIWDQDGRDGVPPLGFDYGQVCGVRSLLAASCTLRDRIGHGTHVAGIAAGREGVAPEADIAVVQSTDFTRMADAVSFLLNLARRRHQSIVINVSVGAHYGAHNGRSLFERFLDQRLGKGEVVVVAAGNDADDRIHMRMDFSMADASGWLRVPLENVPSGSPTATVLELWGDSAHIAQTRLEWLESGVVVRSIDLSVGDLELNADGATALKVTRVDEYSGNLQGQHIVIDASERPLPEDVRFQLAVRGQGIIDGWTAQTRYGYGGARFGVDKSGPGWVGGDAQLSLTVPSTSRSVIAVGSYDLKTDWVGQDGELFVMEGLSSGSLSTFSGRGPSLEPEFTGVKPDITAPGAMIVSSRPSELGVKRSDLSGGRRALQGTSMSAPHISGAVALMLQADPSLTSEQVRDAIHFTARSNAETIEHPEAWGAGKIDIQQAMQHTENQISGCQQTSRIPLLWLGILVWALVWRPRLGSKTRWKYQ